MERIVLCSVADGTAFERVDSACASVGLRAVRISRNEDISAQLSARAVLLIHDLERPEPPAAEVVRQFQTQCPGRPVLIYYKRTPAALELASQVGQRLGVTTLEQRPTAPDEIRDLARFIRRLVMHAPDLLIRTLIGVLLHQSRDGTISRFADALLARLQARELGAPPVEQLAQRAGLGPRRLRRACRAAQGPNPERLTQWLTFIYVLELARCEGISVSRAATGVGVNETYIRRLRAKLVPEVPQVRRPFLSHVLTQAIMRFAEECGLTREQAAERARRVVGADPATGG